MARSLSLAIGLAACGSRGPVAEPVGSAAVATHTVDAAPDAAVDTPVLVPLTQAPPPPKPVPACVPANEADWTCPEVAVGVDGEHAIVCFRERCGAGGEIGCMTVDPKTGTVVGPASWPTATPPDAPAPNTFALTAEGRTVAVCGAGRCNRVRDALPDGPGQISDAAVDRTGTQLFVHHGDETGSTFAVISGRRLARVHFEWKGGPPPPLSGHEVAYHGRGVLIGDFADPGIFELAIDPMTGKRLLLEKPWARLPGDLVAHFGWNGTVELIDFDAHLAIVAKRKGGKPHRPTEGVSGSLVVVGDHALAVAQDPPATLYVDPRARTISPPRPLPLCR